MWKCAQKMQALDDFDSYILPYDVDWDTGEDVKPLCFMEKPCRAF